MRLRVSSVLTILFSVLFLPFWVTIILTLGAMLYFRNFAEGVALFFLSDLLYGVGSPRLFGLIFAGSILSVIFLIVIEVLKKRLKFYPKI